MDIVLENHIPVLYTLDRWDTQVHQKFLEESKQMLLIDTHFQEVPIRILGWLY